MLTSPQSQLSGFNILHSHSLPVKKIAESLSSVTLIDTLPPCLACEIKHVFRKLVDAVIDTLSSAVDDVDTVIRCVFDQFLHVASKPREIGGDRWNTHDRAFCRSVTLLHVRTEVS